MVKVKQAFQTMGFSPNWVEGIDLFGVKMYVPKAARNRLSLALAQAVDEEFIGNVFKGNLLEQIGSGTMRGASTEQIAYAWTYRYLKLSLIHISEPTRPY
mgnify:FL=1